jgi:radical SAM protein with 4Fe4S-binding SPASM domain
MELPDFIQIEPVGQCNLRCQMCPVQFRRDGPPYGPLAFLSFELFTRLIDELPDLRELRLQGLGEPMMHPRFFEMVNYAARRGIEVNANSNLTLLSPRRARQCVESGLSHLHVSLDAASPVIYERIRRNSRFSRVMRNLERLMEARAEHGRPEVDLVVVAMRQNLHELPRLVELAHRHGIASVSVQNLCHDFAEASLPAQYSPMRDFIDREMLDASDREAVEHYFGAARETSGRLGVTLRLPRLEPRIPAGGRRCDWPWHGAYVSYRGEAMPCCMVATPDRAMLGNMAADGVAAVWSNDDYVAFRAQLESAIPPEVCQSCAVYRGTF